MQASPLVVVKTGGALLADADGLGLVARNVALRRRRGERLLVVVSALRGVTDELERAARQALDARTGQELIRDVMTRLTSRHAEAAVRLPDSGAVLQRLSPAFDSLERLLTGIRLTGELTPRMRDLVMAHGERLSAPLVAAALTAEGADARAITAEEAGLVATGPFRVGSCDLAASAPRLEALRHELFDRALVLTGFYGLNPEGDVVLFGRGGTDYTAGVVAACLRADAFELWKDVPGFMTADPREVPAARLVPELSFDEACELGLYGARILHPRCLDPLRGLPIEVTVRPVIDTDVIGTRLVERRGARAPGASLPADAPPPGVVALAARRGVAVVRVQGAAMINEPGVAGRILIACGQAGVNVDAVASSMTSLSFTIAQEDCAPARRALRALQEQGVAGVGSVEIHEHAALLGVVGGDVAGDAHVAGQLLSCLGRLGVDVKLVSHGPGDVGLSVAVPEQDLRRALVSLHETFFGTGAQTAADGSDAAGASRATGASGASGATRKPLSRGTSRAPSARGRAQP